MSEVSKCPTAGGPGVGAVSHLSGVWGCEMAPSDNVLWYAYYYCLHESEGDIVLS